MISTRQTKSNSIFTNICNIIHCVIQQKKNNFFGICGEKNVCCLLQYNMMSIVVWIFQYLTFKFMCKHMGVSLGSHVATLFGGANLSSDGTIQCEAYVCVCVGECPSCNEALLTEQRKSVKP